MPLYETYVHWGWERMLFASRTLCPYLMQDSSVKIDLRSSLLTLDRVQTSLTLFSLSRRLQDSGSKFQVPGFKKAFE